MRRKFASFTILPLVASAMLVACGNDGEEDLSDAALSAEDVDGVSDDGVMPGPGEYATTIELVEFDAPGLDEATLAEARSAFADGAREPHLYCVTEETTRAEWFSQMTEADCTISRLTADGAELDGAMSCNSDIGLDGRVDVAGTSSDQGADLAMTYVVPTQAGEGTLRFRVNSSRVGDCG